MTAGTEALLRMTEKAVEISARLGVHQEGPGGPYGLYLGGAGDDPGELLSEHATPEEAQKARHFLMVQAAMDEYLAGDGAAAWAGGPLTFAELSRWQEGRAEAAFALAGGPPARGQLPEHWVADPRWFCPAGHVSATFAERTGGTWLKTGCPRCGAPVVLGPPITEAQFAAEVRACRGEEPVQQHIEA